MELYRGVRRHKDELSLSLHILRERALARENKWVYTEYVFLGITGPMTHEKNIGIREITLKENFKKGNKEDVVIDMFEVML